MKMLITLLAAVALLSGCGQSQEPTTTEAPAALAEATAPANDTTVDYIWNKASPDLTDEQLTDIVARWNARIDAGGYPMLGANILKPQFETDDFDLIWSCCGHPVRRGTRAGQTECQRRGSVARRGR